MSKKDFCYLFLTCPNTVEAGAVVSRLLNKRLIVCARQTPISSTYWWQDKIEQTTEVLLIMESDLRLFDEVEKEVAQILSYKTFVLEAVPVTRVSKDAEKWMQENLKHG